MEIERSRLSVGFLLKRLRLQTQELINQQYPGNHPGPLKWIKVMNGLLDTAQSVLKTSLSQDDDEAKLSIKDAAHLGSMTYQCIAFLDGADIEQLPYPIILPMQRWFDTLNIKYETLFRAELVANYEVFPFEPRVFRQIRNPAPSLIAAITDIQWPLLRITVPSRAFTIIPHFAIVAHELGHTLYGELDWGESDIDSEFSEERVKIFSRVASRLGESELDDNTKRKFKRIFFAWFEELASDAFAHYLTGPAIFFALSDFIQLLTGSFGISDTHPASDLRRSILFRHLLDNSDTSNSFATIFEKHTGVKLSEDINSSIIMSTPDSDEIFDKMLENYKPEEAAVMAELHESMGVIEDFIYKNVKQYLSSISPDVIYTPEKYDVDLNEHLEAMLDAIPPIEVGETLETKRSTDFATILNIGWVTMLTKLDDLKVAVTDETDPGEKLETFHGLLLKAVELSESRRTWIKV